MYNYLIKNSILRFKNLDSELLSFDDLKKEFKIIFKNTGYSFVPVTIPKGMKLHRVRINTNNTDFENLSELWCPPPSNLKLGRCNNVNEQILYLSGGGHTALNELCVKENDLVTCLECELLENIHVIDIGVVEHLQRELYFQQWKIFDQDVKQKLFKNEKNKIKYNKLLEKFIIEEFTKDVQSNNSFQYKKSAAIASIFLSAPTVQGLIYPSIKSAKKEMNYAIPIAEANKVLNPIRVDVFRMGYFNQSKILEFQLLKGSYTNLNFDKPILYTSEYQQIENWAHEV